MQVAGWRAATSHMRSSSSAIRSGAGNRGL